MKSITDFYEKSGDRLFNLGDPTSNANDSACEIKLTSEEAGGSKLRKLIRRFFRPKKTGRENEEASCDPKLFSNMMG